MKIKVLSTSEQPIAYPVDSTGVQLLNDVAERGAYETAHMVDEETDMVKCVWKFPEGSEVDIPVKAGNALVSLGYAESLEVE
jgi:hypothetical protein